ncbi:MAG: hypothetical protein LAP86_10680 [Acidobacteriia bacterium]|nr:hypothetical protein [Terriglobia bacterium]
MAKKLIKWEKLQRQIEHLEKWFGDRSEATKEQTNQDAAQTTTQNQVGKRKLPVGDHGTGADAH